MWIIQSPYCRSFYVSLVVFLPRKLSIIWVKFYGYNLFDSDGSDCWSQSWQVNWNITIVQTFQGRSIHKVKAFCRKTGLFIYNMFKIPFSGNSKVIDLLQVKNFTKVGRHIPKRIMSATNWKGSLLHPRAKHTKGQKNH